MSMPSGSNTNPVIIHIKPGVYKELIYLQREKRFFKFVGESATNTVLTFGLYASLTNFDGKPMGTFHTPSTTIDADDFTAENLTFENSAGAVGQALAIRVDGDRASFRNCRFLGWQTRFCSIADGSILKNVTSPARWILFFGAATAWFEKCHINCPGSGFITAASTPVDEPFGFVFANCKITGAKPDVKNISRPAVADLRQHDLSEHGNVRGRPPGRLERLEKSRGRTPRRVTRSSTTPSGRESDDPA